MNGLRRCRGTSHGLPAQPLRVPPLLVLASNVRRTALREQSAQLVAEVAAATVGACLASTGDRWCVGLPVLRSEARRSAASGVVSGLVTERTRQLKQGLAMCARQMLTDKDRLYLMSGVGSLFRVL